MPRLRCPILALAALLAVPALAQPAAPAVDRLLRDADAPFHQTVLGLCEDYPEETTTEAVYRADFELLKETGIDLLRISFGWDGIEAEEDTYDWLFWDDFVETAVDEYGITLIPYVMYTPRWAATNKEDAYFWRSPPEDYAEFGEFVFDLVTRYKDRITSWELWNEPDIEWFWTGTVEEFAPFIKAGAEAVRRADPEATIVFGGIAHDTDFLLYLFRDHGVSEYVDVVNMHNYNETWSADPLEDVGAYIRRVSEIIARYGDGQPLWMAEIGYSTYRDGASVSDENLAYYAYEHTPAFQAVQLVRTVTAALATDKLSALAWYEIKDLPPTDEVIGDTNNRHLGVANNDHSWKPAAHALAFADRFYGEPMRSLDREVIVPRTPDSDVVVHAFEQEDGDVLLAAWLQTRRVGEQNDVGEGTHEDTRRRTVEVTVPRDLAGVATRYDELGAEAQHDDVRREAGWTVVPLALEGGEIVLVHLAR
jgi:hypothetical protein